MELRMIRNQREYRAALNQAEALWDSPEGSRNAERLDVLALLIEAYEQRRYPILDPDPIDFLLHVMEARGLARKDLEPMIGSRARVAEVLNRVRPLTLGLPPAWTCRRTCSSATTRSLPPREATEGYAESMWGMREAAQPWPGWKVIRQGAPSAGPVSREIPPIRRNDVR